MKKIHFNLSIGFAGATHADVIEVEDDTTNEEIDQMLEDWASSYLDMSWWEEN